MTLDYKSSRFLVLIPRKHVACLPSLAKVVNVTIPHWCDKNIRYKNLFGAYRIANRSFHYVVRVKKSRSGTLFIQ